jgi:hypothetical protein
LTAGYSPRVDHRAVAPPALAAVGLMALAAGIVLGARATVYAVAVFVVASVGAAWEASRARRPRLVVAASPAPDEAAPTHDDARIGVLSWPTALVVLVFAVWFVPIRKFALPVDLPFDLEVYRLLVLLIGFLWTVALLTGRVGFRAGGQGRPLAVLAASATLALITNIGRIGELGLQTQAIKSLSFFLSFVLVFVVVSSLVATMR